MTFWRGRKAFVTGASGLLGSWLVEELLRRGATVTCLMRDWVPDSRLISEHLLSRTNLVRGELEDLTLLIRALNEYEIDSVFHLGAQTIVGTASRSAISTFESNVRGTWNLLEACKACSNLIERVLVASSDKAYGEHQVLPYVEDTPLQGRFPYDASKACADLITQSYAYTYGIPAAVTRCGNLFGGGDLNFNRLIPGTIRSGLLDESPVIRSDGTLVRDYFYVRDAVDGYLQLAEQIPAPDLVGEAFNLGTQTPLTVLDVVRQTLDVMGKNGLAPTILGEANHEITAQSLDCSKAARRLGWKPRYTFQDGLAETVDWYRHWLQRASA